MKKSIVISLLTVACIFGTAICSFASTGIVTTDTLRLREEASIEASIIGLLSMDEKVEILEEKNGWYKIKAGSQIGYVSADYVNVEGTTSTKENKAEEEEKTGTEENNNSQKQTAENKITIKMVSAGVEVYITPVINSILLDTTSEEVQVEVVSEVNGWSYIMSKNIKGWIRTENITEKELTDTENNNNNTSSQKIGYISGSSVNFREEASTESEVIQTLLQNTKVKVIDTQNGWTKVEYNGRVGYISAQYISKTKVTVTSRSSVNRTVTTKTTTTTNNTETANTTTQGNSTGAEIVAYAKQYLGYKYVYGGATPSGFDCSGYTQYVYKHFGYSLNRSAADQRLNGVAVNKVDLQEGDIICFANASGSKTIGHVGIYIGGGKFIHAANSRKGVIISNVDGAGFYFVCARRII